MSSRKNNAHGSSMPQVCIHILICNRVTLCGNPSHFPYSSRSGVVVAVHKVEIAGSSPKRIKLTYLCRLKCRSSMSLIIIQLERKLFSPLDYCAGSDFRCKFYLYESTLCVSFIFTPIVLARSVSTLGGVGPITKRHILPVEARTCSPRGGPGR